jgi:carotenoid 1,2-hydratase
VRGPAFDVDVAPGGYAWWYVDALSDCGRYALTVIAFVGSVFSPWYARARRGGQADPMQHCAINVALHGPDGPVWVFNERPRQARHRHGEHFELGGASRIGWEGDELVIHLDEATRPFFQRMVGRLRGTIRLQPQSLPGHTVGLDAAGMQRWHCVAPHARVKVDLAQPELRFRGHAYHDANHGDAPLESSFGSWSWCRAPLEEGTAVLYDTTDLTGVTRLQGWLFRRDGGTETIDPRDFRVLETASWGIERLVRTESAASTRVVSTLEASPFYARSLVQLRLCGQTVTAFHESLDMTRFAARWVQFLLPWRIRREAAHVD